jgi:hypothetical protein
MNGGKKLVNGGKAIVNKTVETVASLGSSITSAISKGVKWGVNKIQAIL